MRLPKDFSERNVRHPLEATIDHLIPRLRGGTYRKDNIKAAHAHCNRSKGSKLSRST
nr:HNH endonuclease signature motif containing protein [Bradyrhizobium sp. STM 3843]